MTHSLEAFPKPDSWKAIVHQYSSSPLEEAILEMNRAQYDTISTNSLTFKSPDSTVITLGFDITDTASGEEWLQMSHGEMNLEIFAQACQTIQGHPLLSHIKRLHFKDRGGIFGVDCALPISDVALGLFRSLGPLDELTIHGFNLRLLLPESAYSEGALPPLKEFAISGELMFADEGCVDAIVGLAESQHKLEKPFERVAVRAFWIPVMMVERLRQWVSVADCSPIMNCLAK